MKCLDNNLCECYRIINLLRFLHDVHIHDLQNIPVHAHQQVGKAEAVVPQRELLVRLPDDLRVHQYEGLTAMLLRNEGPEKIKSKTCDKHLSQLLNGMLRSFIDSYSS